MSSLQLLCLTLLILQVVRRIEVTVRDVKWSEAGELVAILSDASFYVLSYDRDAVEAAAGTPQPEDGIEEAFDLLHEIPETVRTGAAGLTNLSHGACLSCSWSLLSGMVTAAAATDWV